MKRGKSVDFTGNWQRHIAVLPSRRYPLVDPLNAKNTASAWGKLRPKSQGGVPHIGTVLVWACNPPRPIKFGVKRLAATAPGYPHSSAAHPCPHHSAGTTKAAREGLAPASFFFTGHIRIDAWTNGSSPRSIAATCERAKGASQGLTIQHFHGCRRRSDWHPPDQWGRGICL